MQRWHWWRWQSATAGRTGVSGKAYIAIFLFLNLADWLGTRWLVGDDSGSVVEANPLAAVVLTRFGWWGMGCYKLTCVAVVLALGHVVGRRRPGAARLLWRTACVILLVLVGYQLGLALARPWDEDGRLLAEQSRRSAELNQQMHDTHDFHERLRARAADLAAGRVTLTAAVAATEADLLTRSSEPPARRAGPFPGWDRHTCLALQLLDAVADEQGAISPETVSRLLDEFESLCGSPVPPELIDRHPWFLHQTAALSTAGEKMAGRVQFSGVGP
jgi:hypothetical protein